MRPRQDLLDYIYQLTRDEVFRRKERKRVAYAIRYRDDPAFRSRERRRHDERYRTDPAYRRRALERCRKCRVRQKASRLRDQIQDFFAGLRRIPVPNCIAHFEVWVETAKHLGEDQQPLLDCIRQCRDCWPNPENQAAVRDAIYRLADMECAVACKMIDDHCAYLTSE